MKVVITVAVEEAGTTRSVTVEESSYRYGDHDDYPPTRVASKAMVRARKALAKLVAPDRAP